MILEVFAILDVQAGAFANPFYAPNAQVALRSVDQAVRAGDSVIAKYPQHFALYHVGSFDDAVGALRPLSPIVCVASTLRGE